MDGGDAKTRFRVKQCWAFYLRQAEKKRESYADAASKARKEQRQQRARVEFKKGRERELSSRMVSRRRGGIEELLVEERSVRAASLVERHRGKISVRQRRARQKFEVGCEQRRRLASNYKPMLAGDKDESCGRHKARQQKGLWLRRLAMGIKLARCKNKTGAARLVWESLRGEARRPGVAERPAKQLQAPAQSGQQPGKSRKIENRHGRVLNGLDCPQVAFRLRPSTCKAR